MDNTPITGGKILDTAIDVTTVNTEDILALLKTMRSAQLLARSEWRNSALVQEALIADPSLIERAALRTVLDGILTVSYTHLDVYKRQV